MDEDAKWYSASFTVVSTQLTPEEIERRLERAPTRLHHLGDPVSPRNRSGAVHKHHYYGLHSGRQNTEEMEVHLNTLLDFLENKAEAVTALSSEATLYFWCGFSSGNGQGGFSISPGLLKRLARLGVEVVLDLYPPSTVEERAG